VSTIKHIQVTPGDPITYPATLAEAKDKLVIDYADHDAKITRLIKVATQKIEAMCNISLVEKTVSLYVFLEGGELFELPYGPTVSVTSVAKLDGNDDEETLVLDTDYRLIGANDAFKILKSYYEGTHIIEYEVGYTNIPESLKEAVLAQVAWLYQNPGDENKGICETAKELASPYIRIWL
jgi:uncharacterized phiE125 gp8 family phage protein